MTNPAEALREREKEALRLLAHGHDAKSIARELALSVHSVNERLRTARRKLGVTSSREAARLLAQAEGDSPNFLGPKPFGLPANAPIADDLPARSKWPFSQHLTIVALGGALIMSLIIAALILTWTNPQASVPERAAEWARINSPDDVKEVRNRVHLDGNSMTWNGSHITEPQLRQYLDITTHMSPQPVLVFSHSGPTKTKRIEAIRALIEDVLQCTPSNCREVTPGTDRS